ncbi:ATP-binding cassette-type vacuolar membrane transporter Hmt1 [Coemansia aciculifera]|nr:ATP-binding cassette-type vacuolar membrane transporter Hmt1 [Coemansia aciculifera]
MNTPIAAPMRITHTPTDSLDEIGAVVSNVPFPAAILPGAALLALVILVAAASYIKQQYPRLRFNNGASDIERQLLNAAATDSNDHGCQDDSNHHDTDAQLSAINGANRVATPFTMSAATTSDSAHGAPLLMPGMTTPLSDNAAANTRTPTKTQSKSKSKGNGKVKVLTAGLGGIAARVDVLQQACNLVVWMLIAECLVHTMLSFALRQEIVRLGQGVAATSLASWLAFAQICIAGAWLLQLPNQYQPPRSHKSAKVEHRRRTWAEYRPVYSWSFNREWFWVLSLIASGCELYAYINCTPPQWENSDDAGSGAQPATRNSMLRTLISIRIITNALLVLAALRGLTLERAHRALFEQKVRAVAQRQQVSATIADDEDERGAASYSSMATIDINPTLSAGNHDIVGNFGGDPAHLPLDGALQHQSPPQQQLGTYGAVGTSAFVDALSVSDFATSSRPSKLSTETTPLVTPATPRRLLTRDSNGDAQLELPSMCDLSATTRQPEDDNEDDDEEDDDKEDATDDDFNADALRSGVKKVRMYHQSDELSHDIMGLRNRLRILLPYLWPSDNRFLQLHILGCVLILAAGRLVNVLVPLQFKIVVDGLSPKDGSPVKFEWVHVILYAILSSLQGSVGMLSTAQSFMWIPVGQYTTKRISVAMFEHLHKLSLRFHVGRKTGEILRVQDRGVTSVVSLLSSILFNIIPTLVDIVLACYFFSVMFDLYFGTIVLTTMASYLAATILLTGWRSRHRRLSNYLGNEMEARAVDSLLNFETVKYYNAEGFETKEYVQAVDDFQVAEWASNATMNMLNTGQNLIIQFGLLAGALLSAKRVSEGKMTVGDFTMLLSYINQLYGPLNWFGTYYRVIQKNFIDMEKLLELFDVPVEVEDPVVPVPLQVPKGEVVFDNVSFSYEKQLTLKNVSFKVPAGSTVAIVGPSGSGKSTILRLLFRFYDVQAGRILIDGQDIRSAPQFDLRQAIGVVPQDTVLFNDSIRYNIAYGRAGADKCIPMKDVTDAADAAHIHHRILGFSEQYETRVGERGQRLSGGEKQRVAIARTLLKDPKIVCLDEATSALDTSTERQIQTSLRDMTRNRTTLIIAHRLSTVIHADQILIVQNGQIVERGTHSELISDRNSVYYDMWIKQLTDAANASYDPILEQANIQIPISAALANVDFQQPSSAQNQHAFSSVAGSAGAQQSGELIMRGGQTNGADGNNDGDDNLSPQRASHSSQTALQADAIAHRHSHADLLGLSNLPNIASGHGIGTVRQVKDHMNLVFGDTTLPRVVMSQGWAAYGPLTEPLTTASTGHLNILGPSTASPIATTSSSLSGLDLSGLAMGGGSRSGGATASIPVGLSSSGLLLDGLGMSLQDPPYHLSQISEEHQHQH